MKTKFFTLSLFILIAFGAKTQVNETFDNSSSLDNWSITTKNSGGTFSSSNGEMILHVNGGSNGYMGQADIITATANYPNLPNNYTNKEINFNINELNISNSFNYKMNISPAFQLYADDNNLLQVGFDGFYSGYSPNGSGYNVWNGHILYLNCRQNGGDWTWPLMLDLPMTLQHYDFKLINEEGIWYLNYKEHSQINFTKINTGFNVSNNIKPRFSLFSGDGGNTYQNGQGTFSIDYFIIKDSEKPATDLTSGLVAYYPFNGNANDESGNGNNGTVNGATTTADRFGNVGKAYKFTNTQNIKVLSSVSLNSPEKEISICFWININSFAGPYVTSGLLRKCGDWGLYLCNPPNVAVASFSSTQLIGKQTNELIGNWHYISYIANKDKKYIYVDGVLGSTQTDNSILTILQANTNGDFVIGADNCSTQNYEESLIDDIRIYNRALSSDEVTQLYNSEKPATDLNTGLVAYYPFNGDAKDESGNGNDGTVNGATPTTDRFGNANKAYYFDGSNNIELNKPFLDGAYTLSLWIKVLDKQPGNHGSGAIFSNGVLHGGWGNGISAKLSTNNDLIGYEKKPTSSGFYLNNLSNPITPTSDYNQYTFVWDGKTTITSAKVYLNGTLILSGACSSNIINASQNLVFGFGSDGGATYPFKGYMDDIRIYNRALSAEEIQELYNETTTCPDLPAKITIEKLTPDINPSAHIVKELATIHNYYIVKDADTDLPVENIVITYTIDNGDEVFKSLPSDKSGILEISFPVYGKNIEDASDDYIKSYDTKPLKFKSIECGEKVTIVKNDFFGITVSVYPFDSDTKKYGFVFSGDMNIDWGAKNWYSSILKGKLDVKPGVKLSFTNIFENGVLSGMEYTNKSDLKGTLSTELPGIPIVPFFKGEVSFTPVSKIYFKETLPTNWQSYLKIYYDLGASLLDKTYNTDEDLHYSLNAISSFLGISNQTKTTIGTSSSNEFKVEAGFSPEINFGGGVSAEISLKGGYEVDFEAGTQKKLDGSINEMVLTNSISSTTTYSFDVDFGFTNVKTKYGASGGASLSNSITISSTKLDNLDLLKEAHIVINKSADLSLNGSFGDVQQNGDNTVEQIKEIGASLSKEYSTDNVLGESFLKSLKNDYKNGVFVSPLARFIVKENNNTSSPLDLYLDNPVNEFKNYLSDKTGFIQNNENINQSLNSTTTKSYTVLGKYSNKLGFKASDHSLWGDKNYKGGVGITCGIFLESEFPLDEQIYDFNLKRSFTRVNYIDDDKIKYLFSPLNPISDLWNNMNTAIKSYANEIYEKSKDFLNTILDEIADEIINIGNNTTRRYSKNLVQYQKLKSSIQSDISTINFQIEGNNKVFNTGTKIKLDYYYPGGELLGITNQADTFVIVSDIFYLNAYYLNDTLKTAPNGNFEVTGKVGIDDLKFLGLDTNSPASVYFKAQDSIRWELLGNVGETLESNVLGTYAIGVSVSNDNIAPEINFAENIVSNTLKMNISDNIGLNWKRTSVFVNGISTFYNRITNTGEIEVDLSKYLPYFNELQVSIIAFDLSGNSKQKTRSYNGLNSSVQNMEKKTDIKLMPNPATESCTIYLSDMVLKNINYSIVDVFGREIVNRPILVNITKFDVSLMPDGLYFVIIKKENTIIECKKLIVEN